MPESLVCCTCSICSLNDDGGSWKLKSARVRHQKRDKRNELSPNNDSELQESIQDSIQNQELYSCYQETFEPELYNLENISEFEKGLENNYRLESVDQFENALGNHNNFEGFEDINVFENESEGNIELENVLENRDEYEYESNITFEGSLEIDDEFENWSESERSDSSITNTTFTDNEENDPFISSELATMIRLLKIKIDMCINLCCTYMGDFKNLTECPYCKQERYQNGLYK
ncbi:3644_t:CDS:2, partial [Scutellospora calospora]